MKRAVWLAGILLAVSFAFPNGIVLHLPQPTPVTVPDEEDTVVAAPDEALVAVLEKAPAADKARIRGIYAAMLDVVSRDTSADPLIKTTEQFELYHKNTLRAAVDSTKLKGKYKGLDAALENVFVGQLGAEKEVVKVDDAVREKIMEACRIVIASTK